MVEVDQPMKALSMHIQKRYLGSHSCNFVNFFLTKLLYAYVQWVYIVEAKYQVATSKAVVGVDRPMKALSMHICRFRFCISVRKLLSKTSPNFSSRFHGTVCVWQSPDILGKFTKFRNAPTD